jgi:medium-chain acyl-[acyl-carrier-protein] hydrolase
MTGVMTKSWFPRVARRRWPRVRLLCVGGAGTGPSEFACWSTELPGSVELWPAQLPDRQAPVPSIGELADDLAEQLWHCSEPSLPWALFGHGFGSLVVYEVAKRILGVLPMCGLIVSAMPVPHRQPERRPDDTLLNLVRRTDGPRRPAPLPCPILALGGAGDPDVRPEDLAQWCEYTSKSFAYQQIGTGHFFHRDSRPDVVATVAAQLDEWTQPVAVYR